MTMTDLPTWTEEYRTADRSNWRTGGAWENEPDKVVWVDEATGLDCMARRNPMGSWCGYVGVTEAHPWHGTGYSKCMAGCAEEDYCWEHSPDARLYAHGGITFAAACHEDADPAEGVCHLSDTGPVWWFGFDTAHGGDASPHRMPLLSGDEYRTLPYVVEQVQGLARQLAEVAA